MLKGCSRSLITLVLALAATGIVSAVCSAREYRSSSSTAPATSSVKQRPVAFTGEPDTPQAPPPARTNTGGIMVPVAPESSGAQGNGIGEWFRQASQIWAAWFARAAR
jgi:hypothetical protein